MIQVSNYIVINSDKKINYGLMRLLSYFTVNNRDFQEKNWTYDLYNKQTCEFLAVFYMYFRLTLHESYSLFRFLCTCSIYSIYFLFCTFQIVVSGVCVPLRSGLCGVKFEVLCLSRGMHGEHQRADQKHTGSFKQSVNCPFFNKLFSVT